jgi:uncharacterized protein
MKIEIKKLLMEKAIPFNFKIFNKDFTTIEGTLREDDAIVSGTVEKVSQNTFLVTLSLEMTMIYPCARCLEPTPIECSYEYSDTVIVEDVELMLNLLSIVEECIYINEPYRVLCSDDCLGLCPKCGNNLNHEQCECSKTSDYDPRFEALRKLL